MKKQKLTAKLSLEKSKISALDSSKIKGGSSTILSLMSTSYCRCL